MSDRCDSQEASASMGRIASRDGLRSLLIEDERASEQPVLFPLPQATEEELDREGLYTAERLFSRRPDAYRSIVELLKQGTGVRAIKKVCRVHHRTIGAVAERERIPIDTGKEKLVSDLRLATATLAESLIEDVMENRLKPEAKPLALGILIDKTELLSGGVTARVETVQTDGPKSWDEWKDRMLKRVSGHEITGSGGEEDGQRAVEPPARVHTLPMPAADVKSVGSLGMAAGATAGATDAAHAEPSAAADDQGGRGSASEVGGGAATTG